MATAWIFTHGIGCDTRYGFSHKYQKEILKLAPNDLFFEFNWQKLVEYNQDQFYKKCSPGLKYKFLRKFMSSFASDALIYSHNSTTYNKINNEFYGIVEQVLLNPHVDKIVIISHSLGTFIISNLLWNISSNFNNSEIFSPLSKDIEMSNFTNKIHLIAYIGSPSSLWSLQFGDGGKNIDYSVFKNLKKVFNIHSPYDVISWPQQCINSTFSTVDDMRMSYGTFFTRKTPFGHIKIWDDPRIIRFIQSNI